MLEKVAQSVVESRGSVYRSFLISASDVILAAKRETIHIASLRRCYLGEAKFESILLTHIYIHTLFTRNSFNIY